MPLYEFAPSFTVDQGDLTLTASGSGVHLNKSVTINLGILDRTSGSIEGNADLLANAYVDNVSVDILNNLGAVEYEDFLTDYKSNVFTFTEYDNINVFGEYTKDFGIRVTVSESSQTHTSEFYFYGNHPEFSGITVQDSTGTTSHSSSQSSKTAVNASGQTGVLTSTITFNNDIAYTNFDRLEIYSSTGSSAFADQINPNPVFSRNLTNQSIQSFDINEGELPNGQPVYLHYVPYGNLGTGAVWTVGPYTFEDNPIATNQYITKDDTGDFGGNQDLSGVLTNGNSAELGFIVGASEITGDLTVGGDIITDSATTIGACGEVLNLKGDFVTLQYCPGISSAETPQTFLQISSSEQVEFYRQGNFASGLYVNHSQSIEFGGKSKIFTDNQSGVSSLNLESDKIIFNISGSSDEQIDLRNIVGSFGSAILLGTKNRIFGDYDGIVAGTENVISGDSTYSSDFSFIGAGSGNEITGSDYASIVGGIGNNILKTSDNSFIGGGTGNVLEGSRNSVIGGGVNNYINSAESVQIFGSYITGTSPLDGYIYLADNQNRTKTPDASDTLFIDFEGGVDIKTGDLTVVENITMGGDTVATQDWVTGQGYITSETDDQTLDEVLTQGNVSASGITVGSSTISGDLDVSGALAVINDDTGVSDIFSVDGVNGRLFGVTDEVTGTVFSVNDAAGLPIVEVESTSGYDKITIGEYGSDALVISGTNSALFNVDVDITGGLDVTGDITMGGETVLTGITSGDITGALGYTPLSSETDDQTLDEVLTQGNVSASGITVGSSTISGAGTSTFTVDSTNSFGRSLTLSTNGISPAISAENELTIKTSNNDTEIKLEGGGSTDNIQFIANEVEQVRITTAGVGIGTTSPNAALHVDDGDAIIGRVGAGSPNSTLTVAGYDDFGLDFKAHNTWTHWKARVGHNKNFELYNDGANNDNQTLQLGKTNATENASLLLFSTGVFMDVGRNPNYPLARFGVDAANTLAGDLYLDIRSSTTVTDRFEFNRGGEFIASGIGVGYTSPSYELDVSGSGHFLNDLIVDEDITMGGNIVLTGITSGDITGALGYTPLSSETDDQTLDEVLAQGNTSTRDMSVGDISGTSLDITTDVTVTGDVEADEFIGDLRGAVSFRAKAGEALSAGDVVYISGIDGNTTVVAKADADDSNKMPAFGVSKETVNVNANVRVVNFGSIDSLDTSAYSEGDELFVSDVAGLLTGIAPTGEASALQKMAKVTRSHASSGSITVMGAGRTNAVPNLNEGRLFVGNSSNEAVADGTIHVDIVNSRVGIGTTSPADKLHVLGKTIVQAPDGSNTTLELRNPVNTDRGVRIIGAATSSGSSGVFDIEGFGAGGILRSKMDWGPTSNLTYNLGSSSTVWTTTFTRNVKGRANASQGDLNLRSGHTSSPLTFGIDSTEYMRVHTNGNVGIGTTSPSSILETSSNGSLITVKQSVSGSTFNGVQFKAYSGGINGGLIWNQSTGEIRLNAESSYFPTFYSSGSERMRINSSGNVGIGLTDPTHKLEVSDSGNAISGDNVDISELTLKLRKDNDSNDQGVGLGFSASTTDSNIGAAIVHKRKGSDSYGELHFATKPSGASAGSDIPIRMTINSSGNVGIGTTSPDYELHVIGTASFTDTVAGAYFEENASHESLKSMRTGFILVMDEDGELVPCTKENDTTVFGVAKKGYKQPIIMGAEPIKITGPIKVGDFITTSNVEGHGMKAENPQFGTIIAQAMESGDGESYNIKAMIRKM